MTKDCGCKATVRCFKVKIKSKDESKPKAMESSDDGRNCRVKGSCFLLRLDYKYDEMLGVN